MDAEHRFRARLSAHNCCRFTLFVLSAKGYSRIAPVADVFSYLHLRWAHHLTRMKFSVPEIDSQECST